MVLWLLCIYRDSTTSPPPRAPPSGFPPPVPHRLITTWAYTKQIGHTKRGESMNGSMRADANESDGEECLTGRRARSECLWWMLNMVRRSLADYQAMCSPYKLGVSPRMNASNVLFRTADQSRSRLSSATLSSHSPSSSTAPAMVRAIRSPLMNRGPRSGQCRIVSNGCHLKALISPLETNRKAVNLPEVVEVV